MNADAEVVAVARALRRDRFARNGQLRWYDPTIEPTEPELATARAAIAALDAVRGWQPIATAPKKGNFLAWHDGFQEVRTVWLFDGMGKPDLVINGPNGRFFKTRWWMPMRTPPDAAPPEPEA
jgi:hypothetical protein